MPIPLTLESRVVVHQETIYTDLENEAVVLDLHQGMYYGLDELGTLIWKLIQEPRTVGEIRDRIVSQYEVAPGECGDDLIAFLEELKTEGLIDVQTEIAG